MKLVVELVFQYLGFGWDTSRQTEVYDLFVRTPVSATNMHMFMPYMPIFDKSSVSSVYSFSILNLLIYWLKAIWNSKVMTQLFSHFLPEILVECSQASWNSWSSAFLFQAFPMKAEKIRAGWVQAGQGTALGWIWWAQVIFYFFVGWVVGRI